MSWQGTTVFNLINSSHLLWSLVILVTKFVIVYQLIVYTYVLFYIKSTYLSFYDLL